MLDEVLRRLEALGLDSGDGFLIEFIIDKVSWRIMNLCNLPDVPDGLLGAAADMVCGEFLFEKKALGELEGFEADAAVKRLQEGDTNITFAIGEGSSTPEQRLDALIQVLLDTGNDALWSYRRLRW